MTYDLWGPLGGLVGAWESGYDGLDTSFHNVEGKVAETAYRECTTFAPFGPIENGDQCLYGLDYRTASYRSDEDVPFHTEVGYWLWDASARQVTRCFAIPRGQVLIAGGGVEPDATSFSLGSTLVSNTYGILSNPHIDTTSRTTRFDVTITIGEDSFTYEETTVIEHAKAATVVMHTDRNTLKRVDQGD